MGKDKEKNEFMRELQDRYVRFDWAIKRLLRQKANFGVLEGFLTVFLGEKITIVEILESEGNQIAADDKFNRVDIKALNSKGEIIIIEVQNEREYDFLERVLYGVAKAITEHISLGEPYHKVKKVYSISILYFDIGIGADYIYHGQNIFTGVHTKDQLQVRARERDAIIHRYPSEIFPEYILIRVNEFDKVAVTPMEEWMRYLKDGTIKANATAPGLREAREKLQYYSMSPADRYAYERHMESIVIQNDVIESNRLEGLTQGREEGREEGRKLGLEEGRKEGLKEGREEGRKEGRKEGLEAGRKEGIETGIREGFKTANLENAKKMKSLGIDPETIRQITGIDPENY